MRTMSTMPSLFLAAVASLPFVGTPRESRAAEQVALEISKIFFEYNSTDNDLGVEVSLDGEEWRELRIVNPNDKGIFHVEGRGPYKKFGLSELFFEGAEPTLTDVPLEELLGDFPAGAYQFKGRTVDNAKISGTGMLSHAIPAGPSVSTEVTPGKVVIKWTELTAPPPGFPNEPINIVGYQIIVDPFQVTLPGSARMVTLPPEFVASLAAGSHDFEVLAIEASGNQTITSGTFVTP
jgi:hypothetical protein